MANLKNHRFHARSLRTRILLCVGASALLMLAATLWIVVSRVQHLSRVQLLHEGLLLSHSLEAAMGDLSNDRAVADAQRFIDRLVAVRERNDVEINVLLREGEASRIVASNDPDNVKVADDEEHAELLAALEAHDATIVIDHSSPHQTAQDVRESNDPSHPNYFFPPGSRYLSVTTPLFREGEGVGSINVILSLRFLDQEQSALIVNSLAALGVGLLVLAGFLMPYLAINVFNPLRQLAKEMDAFGQGRDVDPIAAVPRRDEIGILQSEFRNMVVRARSAEAVREQLARAEAEKKKRELEAQLLQAQKMEALGTLAGGIAHDFNNTLTPIMGFAELSLLKLPAENGQVRGYIEEIFGAARRARELVRQILTFSRQGGETKSEFPIGPVVEEALKLLRATIPANVELSHQIEASDRVVFGNPTQIHRIVLNLVTNAYHAMDRRGGRLQVNLFDDTITDPRTIEGGWVLVPGTYAKLEVADTGEGMRPEVLERVFEPYFTTKPEGEGTGLGLAMVHGIVRDMRGAVWAESAAGGGTTFHIYLPIGEAHSVAGDETGAHGLPGGRERVLIVDDEEPIARMIGEMLQPLGYDTCVVTDPGEVLARLTDDPRACDLVISDLAMPRMTGLELARALSNQGVCVPLILCSAYRAHFDLKTAGALGIHSLLVKPLERHRLATAVRTALDDSARGVRLSA